MRNLTEQSGAGSVTVSASMRTAAISTDVDTFGAAAGRTLIFVLFIRKNFPGDLADP